MNKTPKFSQEDIAKLASTEPIFSMTEATFLANFYKEKAIHKERITKYFTVLIVTFIMLTLMATRVEMGLDLNETSLVKMSIIASGCVALADYLTFTIYPFIWRALKNLFSKSKKEENKDVNRDDPGA